MRESSWRNYDDPQICGVCGCSLNPDGVCPFEDGANHDDEDDDPLAPIPPQPGFDNELWHNREDDELGEVEEDEE